MVTRIISVNDVSWERFAKRREIIVEDLTLINDANISIYDAITPKDWINNENGTISFNNELMNVTEGTHWVHVSNWLSHYELWKNNEDMLVLEDDITIDKQIYINALSLIEEFKTINEEYKLLYLQSTSPWFTGLKTYNISDVEKQEGNLYKLGINCTDVSGTGAYFIDAKTATFLLETSKRFSIKAADSYMHNLVREGILKYYIPTNFQDWFKLTRKTE